MRLWPCPSLSGQEEMDAMITRSPRLGKGGEAMTIANPEKDEKIQEMMGFLNEDDGDCLFKLASVASRKKSNTVEYQKRERPSAIAN